LPFRDGEQTAKPATTDNEGDALSKADLIFRRNRNISIVGAMSGFLFYVWYRGLVSVEFTNVESADDEEGETAAYRYNSNESVENDENEDDEE
jgi:hypothetical protein